MANRGKGYGPPLSDISESVGNTPLVKISSRTCPVGRTIYAKCEYFNPLSSVKDRLALAIIEAGERDGSLRPGQTVVEATSGNTGIGEIFFSFFSIGRRRGREREAGGGRDENLRDGERERGLRRCFHRIFFSRAL
jgi:hypothetical protein